MFERLTSGTVWCAEGVQCLYHIEETNLRTKVKQHFKMYQKSP